MDRRYGLVVKRKQKLKVFRTPIGFHDAVVAAPSRKAALAAWGSGTDLFSAGIAEEVGDLGGKEAKAALAKPGEVVRVGRDGAKDSPSTGSGRTVKRTAALARPKPSRAAVEQAEAALATLEQKHAAERAALTKDEEKLAKRRRALEAKQRKAMDAAEAKREAAKARYREAMADWGG